MQPKHAHFLVKWSKVGERRKERARTETRDRKLLPIPDQISVGPDKHS